MQPQYAQAQPPQQFITELSAGIEAFKLVVGLLKEIKGSGEIAPTVDDGNGSGQTTPAGDTATQLNKLSAQITALTNGPIKDISDRVNTLSTDVAKLRADFTALKTTVDTAHP